MPQKTGKAFWGLLCINRVGREEWIVRLKVIDRILAAFTGLFILVIGIGLFVFSAGIFPFTLDLSFVTQTFLLWQRAVMVAAAIALCFLGLHSVSMLFRSSKEKGFFVQHTEYGDLSISMSAMENMVKKCVATHDELKVSNTRIHHVRDGVVISIRIALANGVNIPITVSVLQKQIKQYITSCSGIDVKEVRVLVETSNGTAAACPAPEKTMVEDAYSAVQNTAVVGTSQAVPQTSAPSEAPVSAEEDAKKPLHQRLFKRDEKPQIIPQPPQESEADSSAAIEKDVQPSAQASVADETAPADAYQDEPAGEQDTAVETTVGTEESFTGETEEEETEDALEKRDTNQE